MFPVDIRQELERIQEVSPQEGNGKGPLEEVVHDGEVEGAATEGPDEVVVCSHEEDAEVQWSLVCPSGMRGSWI